MDSDDWTSAALTDVAVVADVLLRLKYSSRRTSETTTDTSMRTETKTKTAGLISFRWGRRKTRSRPEVKRFAMSTEFKDRETRSPTTPLSWSGGCGTSVSGSGNVDGFEASSVMDGRSTGSRSKDLANMHASGNHHRMTNLNLKSIKSMNMHSRRVTTSVTHHPVVCVPIQKFTSATQRNISKAQDSTTEIPQPSVSSNNLPEAMDKKSFTLPDLNMSPSVD